MCLTSTIYCQKCKRTYRGWKTTYRLWRTTQRAVKYILKVVKDDLQVGETTSATILSGITV